MGSCASSAVPEQIVCRHLSVHMYIYLYMYAYVAHVQSIYVPICRSSSVETQMRGSSAQILGSARAQVPFPRQPTWRPVSYFRDLASNRCDVKGMSVQILGRARV